jgi:hypothetical protein
MNGWTGSLVLVSSSGEIVEQRIKLSRDSYEGLILNGELAAWYNLNSKYYADTIYLQEFSKSFSTKNCKNNNCATVTFTRVGD